MNVKELKELIEKYPDDMLVQLQDLTTDSEVDCAYNIEEENIEAIEYYESEDDETPKGKLLIISFENKLNPNPINK